ncbi:OLC1v1028798C2 [Oldenlandia corymbosa var. corymbosa]|uniref:OLC1v1028798C2 n=1 Tax=Oldenlandia corymbosa var. corymbosa TaxID=529605 RepID=A0AAV1CFB6_OLDCO|nr:OLC1v1028798C2 [Oldenlandia corymbosa var. corymbosa]
MEMEEDVKEMKPSTPPRVSTASTSSSSNPPVKEEEIDGIEARFNDFCKSTLSMEDDCTKSEALKLFRESKHLLLSSASNIGTGLLEEAERYWFAFVLFSVKRLSSREAPHNSSENNNTFTLCHILRLAKLNFVDFFKELSQFILKVGPILANVYGVDWEKKFKAKELQANFVHLQVLSKFYKRAFRELFETNDVSDKDSAVTNPLDCTDYHRFGWLLFLALRVHVFGPVKTVVTDTTGLVSILAILITHVPIRFRKFSINDSSRFVRKGDKVDIIASLCKSYETSEVELKTTLEKTNQLIVQLLKMKSQPASECKKESLDNIDTDGLVYFDDLMEEPSLSSCLRILEKDHDDALHDKVEIDERIFVKEEDSLLGSGSLSGGAVNLSGGAVNLSGSKRKIDMMASPAKTITSPLSPFRSPSASHTNATAGGGSQRMAATPVSTAMTTAKWLRAVIAPLPSKPSPELEKFLSSCDRDVTGDVVRRAQIILEAIFPSYGPGEYASAGGPQMTSLMDNVWAEHRRIEALKLYYRVLLAMCVAESQILHANNLTSLLTNERFHRCMLACSAELVLATHKTATMLFPAVLERTGITAFDLSKVIESFIRHEESLPRELRRHLNSLEERLLESMVWEKGSSMYNSLTVARPALSAEINRLGLLAEPMPSLDAIAMHINMSSVSSIPKNETVPGAPVLNGDIRSPKRLCTELRSVLVERNSFTSPVKDRLMALNNLKSKFPSPALQSAFASPTRPNPGGGGETCAETAISVFFGKIVKLAAVRINGMVERLQLSQQIRETVYCFFQKILSQQTSLFFNRHIDQIILCCFYGVAKISNLNITFKEIVFNYRKQPHCKPQVFRGVFIDWSTTRRTGKTGQDHVDIITFYNEVFVPSVKPLLVELSPAGAVHTDNHSATATNDNDGQCPTSPKASSFPSLPDMSPKKVSAVHNVYVSPLRSSKRDALISHTSKSYYACVGESTHAYQSPSKDLTAINNRLNGNRKLRGALNFDDVDVGLVSDSLVANSLYLQNGNGVSSSCPPLKSEQPDS